MESVYTVLHHSRRDYGPDTSRQRQDDARGQSGNTAIEGYDRGADGFGFVASEIVHDDDVAWLEGCDQLLFDIGQEARPIDRAIEDAGRGDPVAPQRRQKGHRAPASMWRETCQALALRPPPSQWGHVGLDPGFIDEDETLGIEPGLQRLPASTPAGDRRPAPLKSEQRFF